MNNTVVAAASLAVFVVGTIATMPKGRFVSPGETFAIENITEVVFDGAMMHVTVKTPTFHRVAHYESTLEEFGEVVKCLRRNWTHVLYITPTHVVTQASGDVIRINEGPGGWFVLVNHIEIPCKDKDEAVAKFASLNDQFIPFSRPHVNAAAAVVGVFLAGAVLGRAWR